MQPDSWGWPSRGSVSRAWHSAAHGEVFCAAVDGAEGLWEKKIAYQSQSGSISICHVCSSGVLAAGWLLCSCFFISVNREQTKAHPMSAVDKTWSINNPLSTEVDGCNLQLSLPRSSTYRLLSWKLSTMLYSIVVGWMWIWSDSTEENHLKNIHSSKSLKTLGLCTVGKNVDHQSIHLDR